MTVTDKFPRAQRLAQPRSARSFALPVRLEQRVEPLAHQHARPIGGHVHLELAAHVDDRVRVGRFQYIPVLLDDGLVPCDELRGRTILLAIVSVEDLDELDRAVVHGVAELKITCRRPEGYSISIVRQNGLYQ